MSVTSFTRVIHCGFSGIISTGYVWIVPCRIATDSKKGPWGLLVPWSAADLGKGYIITLKRLGISLIHFSCLHGRCLISECSCCQHQLVSWARRRRRYSPLYQRAMELNKRDNFKMRCRPVNRERVVNIGEVFSVWVSQPPHAWLIAIE